jgi:choline-phosphate cytidylyltransferase
MMTGGNNGGDRDAPSSPLGLGPTTSSSSSSAAAGFVSGPGGGYPFPRSPTTTTAGERATNNVNDFITGYTLGLIGGVRSWVGYSSSAVLTSEQERTLC